MEERQFTETDLHQPGECRQLEKLGHLSAMAGVHFGAKLAVAGEWNADELDFEFLISLRILDRNSNV